MGLQATLRTAFVHPQFDLGSRTAVTDSARALGALGEIEGFLSFAIDSAAALGASTNQLAAQGQFVGKLSDSISQDVSSMIDTSIEKCRDKAASLEDSAAADHSVALYRQHDA